MSALSWRSFAGPAQGTLPGVTGDGSDLKPQVTALHGHSRPRRRLLPGRTVCEGPRRALRGGVAGPGARHKAPVRVSLFPWSTSPACASRVCHLALRRRPSLPRPGARCVTSRRWEPGPWPPLSPPSRCWAPHVARRGCLSAAKSRADPVPYRCSRPARPSRRRQTSGERHLRRPAPGTSRGETGAAVTGAPASRTRTALRRPVGPSCHPCGRTHRLLLTLQAAPDWGGLAPARGWGLSASRPCVAPPGSAEGR